MLSGSLASSNTCIPSVCTHLPHWYLTLHPGRWWWNRENHKEIQEGKHKLGKVAASTFRKKRRGMLCLRNMLSKPKSDNVGLVTLQKRRFVLLLFIVVPCCHPSQFLCVTLGKSLNHSLEFFLSTALSLCPAFCSVPLVTPARRRNATQHGANVVAQPSGRSWLTSLLL